MIYVGQSIAKSPAVCLARVKTNAGTYITQSAIATIVVKVFDTTTATLTTTTNPTVADVVYNTLQTDDRWQVDGDTTGYNVAIPIGGASMPLNRTYQIEATFTPTTGDAFIVLWQLEAEKVYS